MFVRQQPLLLDNRIEAMDYRNQIRRLIGSKWSSPEAHIGGGGSSSPPRFDRRTSCDTNVKISGGHQNRRRLRDHTTPSIVDPFVDSTRECTEHESPPPTAIVLGVSCICASPLPVSLARSLVSFVLEAFSFVSLSLVISHMTTNTYGGSHRVASGEQNPDNTSFGISSSQEATFLFSAAAISKFNAPSEPGSK